ncbi:hypothetical protein MMC16_003059 [Acarospora aff. strigata]|nr:hypothetical protein [Acarospora aff. strigata]
MTDLLHVVPSFPTKSYTHLLPSLEKNLITTTDLLSLDALEIAKRAQLPLLDVRRLANHVLKELQSELGLGDVDEEESDGRREKVGRGTLRKTGRAVVERWTTISTLDEALDVALGGGIPTGYITEITGESGAGKSQFLLTLLLTAQLPPPQGLSCNTLYISTESALSTTRLSQLLTTHPHLCSLPPSSRPTLDRVLSIHTPDLESQDHILTYQVPVAIARHNIGLVVLDSVAANYRAEFSNSTSSGQHGAGAGTNPRPGLAMAKRSAELVRLGQLLRDLARTYDVAVVVANQILDRIEQKEQRVSGPSPHRMPSSPPPASEVLGLGPSLAQALSSSAAAPPSSSPSEPTSQMNRTSTPRTTLASTSAPNAYASAYVKPLTLDHQQRFFTGWGDVPILHPNTTTSTEPPSNLGPNPNLNLKTPSLGLTWTNQIACRIALLKEPFFTSNFTSTDGDGHGRDAVTMTSRRWMKVVFAPWVRGAEGRRGVEFEITGSGVRSVSSIK